MKIKIPFILRIVAGKSMLPNLRPGKLVIAKKTFNFSIGDIVIFNYGQIDMIKRIHDLKDGKVYLLGDNQEESTDSRHWGWIDQSKIFGKLIWPVSRSD